MASPGLVLASASAAHAPAPSKSSVSRPSGEAPPATQPRQRTASKQAGKAAKKPARIGKYAVGGIIGLGSFSQYVCVMWHTYPVCTLLFLTVCVPTIHWFGMVFGFARVCTGVNTETGEQVALKVVDKQGEQQSSLPPPIQTHST